MFDLLQIADSLNQVVRQMAGDANGDGSLSFFELLTMGGWIMIPLGLMLLIAVYVFAERSIAIRNASKIDDNFMNIVRDHIITGNITAARSFAQYTNIISHRIMTNGINSMCTP